ncbi:MAG: ornithine carbamoyltransferase [Phycisphaeraceae bacterium]|nr:MAG: ornithine carbamoyltransferase [Phycisphaeraceae bacterium]
MISLIDWSADEVAEALRLAGEFKEKPLSKRGALDGKVLGMIFEKSSTRTRVSFEVATLRLGGHALFLSTRDIQLGRGETIADTARVLGRMCNGIMARVFEHEKLAALTASGLPVINGLSDLLHPCQALADALTIIEHKGSLEGRTLAYLGDGNNVAHSLINLGARSGLAVRVGTPERYGPDPAIVAAAREAGADVTVTHDPVEAVQGVDVVYTDTWASMGQEAEAQARAQVFAPFRIDEALFAKAAPDAIFMHCLPAHRGDEVTDAVIEHERSVVFDEAENRLHTEQAVLFMLMA